MLKLVENQKKRKIQKSKKSLKTNIKTSWKPKQKNKKSENPKNPWKHGLYLAETYFQKIQKSKKFSNIMYAEIDETYFQKSKNPGNPMI